MKMTTVLCAGAVLGYGSAASIGYYSPDGRASPDAGFETPIDTPATAGSSADAISVFGDPAFSDLVDTLEKKRVVFIGETHDRLDHHVNQLAVIRAMHERGVDVAVGVEFFQEPFQPVVDAFLRREIGEKELLKQTEYHRRWKFDFRLYRDIVDFARNERIPLIALNAPAELVRKVSEGGIAGLPSDDRGRLPTDIPEASDSYLERLRPVFEMHGNRSQERFQRFVDVQTLWDEHMARAARDFLLANPQKTLVVLAGSGHVAYPDAIPDRLARMLPADSAILVTQPERVAGHIRVDAVLAARPTSLPEPGRLGLALALGAEGVTVNAVYPGSSAADAGVRPGDRLVALAGERIRDPEDVRLALLDRAPGEAIWVELERRGTTSAKILTLI